MKKKKKLKNLAEVRHKNLSTKKICPYCGHKVKFVTGDELAEMMNNHPNRSNYKVAFVAAYKHYYVCSNFNECQAYVGAYESTYDPMGEMADTKLRFLRIKAHKSFDEIWQNNILPRDQAYAYLADKLGLTRSQTHIAKFGKYYCQKTIKICETVLKNNGLTKK